MMLFALLHGGMHSGSCWRQVQTELERRGHRTVAPDLPVDDEDAGATAWAQTAIDAIGDGVDRDDVVVVGHSISGLCLPVLAALRPVRRMVFVGGLLPVPGQTFADHLAVNPDAISFPVPASDGTGPFGLTWESVREGFYHDCPELQARLIFQQLRHQAFRVLLEPCPIGSWPDTPSTYVLMRDDRAVSGAWARRNAVERIEAQLIELDGGHSPFLARPIALADALIAAAGCPR
jgi:pimeloyl-ACP methyl ester carboxylesterase